MTTEIVILNTMLPVLVAFRAKLTTMLCIAEWSVSEMGLFQFGTATRPCTGIDFFLDACLSFSLYNWKLPSSNLLTFCFNFLQGAMVKLSFTSRYYMLWKHRLASSWSAISTISLTELPLFAIHLHLYQWTQPRKLLVTFSPCRVVCWTTNCQSRTSCRWMLQY